MFYNTLKVVGGIFIGILLSMMALHLEEIKNQKTTGKGIDDFVPTSTYSPSFSAAAGSVQVKTFLVEIGAKEAEMELNQWLAADLDGQVIIDRKEAFRQDDRHIAVVYWYRIRESPFGP